MPIDQNTQAKDPGQLTAHFGKFTGIKNTVPRTGLKPDELYVATNFYLDDNGELFVKPGYSRLFTGKWQIWSDGLVCYGVHDGNLMQIMPDLSEVLVKANVSDNPISFVRVSDKTYWTNGLYIEYIKAGVSAAMPSPTGSYKDRLMPGQTIGYYRSHLYVCTGAKMQITDAANYTAVDGYRGFKQFPATIVTWNAVDDGLYVSTTEKIYYLEGKNPEAMFWTTVAEFPARSAVEVPADIFNVNAAQEITFQPFRLDGKVIIMDTVKGVCMAANGGIFRNLTAHKHTPLTGAKGASVFKRGTVNQIISTVQ